MPKSTIEYWNPLIQAHKKLWQPIAGLEGMVEELTLSIDTEHVGSCRSLGVMLRVGYSSNLLDRLLPRVLHNVTIS